MKSKWQHLDVARDVIDPKLHVLIIIIDPELRFACYY